MFDHGKSENEIRYGSPDPPKYSLEAIKSQHIAIVYGENDLIVTLKNVAAIKNSLQGKILHLKNGLPKVIILLYF